jgi:hypothetical protein
LIDYEKTERYLAKKLLDKIKNVEDYWFTKGRVCYDIEILLKNEKMILGEVKVRNFKIDAYPDYILQVDKLISLINTAIKKKSDLIYYINFFDSDKPEQEDFIVFNLMPRIQEWKTNKPIIVKKMMNSETCVSTDYKIIKQVILLTYNPKIDMKGTFNLK